jgi:hypothetical protein
MERTSGSSIRPDNQVGRATESIAALPADWFLWAALESVVKFLGSESRDRLEHFSDEGTYPPCSSASPKVGEGNIEGSKTAI